MDLIYTDQGRIELGVIQNFNVDFDTTGNMDFQLTVGIQNNLLQGGFYWYIEGTEYGGRVDSYKVLTASNEIQYTGRNFRGILNTKVIEPPKGEDYKILSGTMSEVASTLISDARLGDLFVVDECDVEVSKYKFNRYIKTYDGLNALCVAYGLVPSFKVQDGMVHIAFGKATDYSDENEYTQDDLSFTITKTYANVNHLICLGQGDMKDRTVCHLYADADGNISETQSLFGQDEITEIYENTNAEDLAELKQEGITRLSELKNKDSFEVTASNLDLKIGDIIGGIERVTNTYVAREIVNIIAKIDDYKVDLEYKVGEDEAKRATSFGVSSGGSTSTYILPVATTEVLGGVKQGENVTIAEDGTISADLTSRVSTDTGFGQNLVNHPCSDDNAISGTSVVYSAGDANGKPTGTDHALLQMAYNDLWKIQLAMDWRTNKAYIRGCQNGAWSNWDELALASYLSNYLPLTGGTLTGQISAPSMISSFVGVNGCGGVDANAWGNGQAKVYIDSIPGSATNGARAQIAFHNQGMEASTFYYDGGNFRYCRNDGNYFTLTATNTSDRRKKNDLGVVEDAEAQTILEGIPIHLFTYINDDKEIVRYGAMAQDVRDLLIDSDIGYRPFLEILHFALGKNNTPTLTEDLETPEEDVSYNLDYTQIVPVLWKGWQMHEAKIKQLEERIKALEERMDES